MQLTIDGKTVTARRGESVLRCALRNRIYIPHLCTHPSLPAFGACRLCIVEIDGMRGFPASCTTPVSESMVVHTDTAGLKDLRRRVLELILLEHPSACLVCDKQDLCEKYRPKSSKAGRTVGCHTCNNKEVCEVRALADMLELTYLPVAPVYRDIVTDSDKLEKIVQNVLTNSIKNTATGGISIEYGTDREMFFVEVKDTGAGIPGDKMDMVFKRFYRGEDSKGIGLGLAIVKELVDAMGGRIDLTSRVGEGTVFRIWLPMNGKISSKNRAPISGRKERDIK